MLHYLQNLFQALDVSSLTDAVLRVAAVFLCLTVHETCHGLAALALGDPTAKSMHRLSLNPLHHIDWLGLALSLRWVSAGQAVPVNPNYFRKPKQGMAAHGAGGAGVQSAFGDPFSGNRQGDLPVRAVQRGHECFL